jgi:hypothetical protein
MKNLGVYLYIISTRLIASLRVIGSFFKRACVYPLYELSNLLLTKLTSRDITVGADGDFRFSQLPVGTYVVTVSRNDGTVIARDTFSVTLNGNTTAVFVLEDTGTLEEITVTAARQTFDTYSTDSGVVIGEAEIDLMPVARNLTSVALLAPGTVKGDVKWDVSGTGGAAGYASFGGSSVAENSCYINGLEVTNTRQGLGCGELPFEFYDQFQIKTGGYSAQYGRTTGGVINATSKSGTRRRWRPP